MLESIVDTETLIMIMKVTLAGVLGMFIGSEREYRGKAAGLRTYMLVSLGAALFTILSSMAHAGDVVIGLYDPTRIAAQVVVGIGFIGAGLIIFKKDRLEGLTTAAGLWTTAAIGMAVGFGFYSIAIYSTILVVLVLWALRYIDQRIQGASPGE